MTDCDLHAVDDNGQQDSVQDPDLAEQAKAIAVENGRTDDALE